MPEFIFIILFVVKKWFRLDRLCLRLEKWQLVFKDPNSWTVNVSPSTLTIYLMSLPIVVSLLKYHSVTLTGYCQDLDVRLAQWLYKNELDQCKCCEYKNYYHYIGVTIKLTLTTKDKKMDRVNFS